VIIASRGSISVFKFTIKYAGGVDTREKFCALINDETLRNGLPDLESSEFLHYSEYNKESGEQQTGGNLRICKASGLLIKFLQ